MGRMGCVVEDAIDGGLVLIGGFAAYPIAHRYVDGRTHDLGAQVA